MMLTYRFVKQLFPHTRGVADDSIEFRHLFINPKDKAEKGLFVPLYYEEDVLKTGIENGAIAALWREDIPLPRYVPNHFPVFFVSSPSEALKQLVKTYIQTDEAENNNMTRFCLNIEHIQKNDSYDIAVIKELQQLKQQLRDFQGKEGRERSC